MCVCVCTLHELKAASCVARKSAFIHKGSAAQRSRRNIGWSGVRVSVWAAVVCTTRGSIQRASILATVPTAAWDTFKCVCVRLPVNVLWLLAFFVHFVHTLLPQTIVVAVNNSETIERVTNNSHIALALSSDNSGKPLQRHNSVWEDFRNGSLHAVWLQLPVGKSGEHEFN